MKTLFRSFVLTSVLAHLLAGTSRAHFGGEAFILVPVDHVLPGQPFEIIVADLAPGSTIELTATRDGVSAAVGSALSDTEGHFKTSGMLPADFPHGYFELVATAGDGTRVSTWVLAGPRTSATGTAPAPATAGGLDPSLLVLIVLLGGTAGAVVLVLLRRATAPAQRVAARRAVPSKRSRARSRQA